MNIGLSLCGINYGVKNRDWRRDCENITNNIINIFNPKIYITTYTNETDDELVNYYKPTKYQFLDLNNSDLRLTYIKSLELLKGEDLDFIITTRFDILFNEPLSSWNIDLNKFNFLFKEMGWWENHKYTADPQYFSAFNSKYIDNLIRSVKDVYDNPHRIESPDLHPTYSRLEPVIGSENINFIFDIETLSHDNNILKLDRW